MTFNSFVLAMFLFPSLLQARWDFAISGLARTYPLAAGLDFEVGQSLLLWGQEAEANPWYGYIRPAAYISTSGTFNAVGGTLEFFPLSILGVKAGSEIYNNSTDYRDYDCELFQCEGDYYRQFVEGHLILGAGPWFLTLRARRSFFDKTKETGPFVVLILQ